MYASGCTIEASVNVASGEFAFLASAASFVSRSGPTLALEPAAFNVWHAPQPLEVKTALPAAAAAGAAAAVVVCWVVAAAAVVVCWVVAAAVVACCVVAPGVVACPPADTVTVVVLLPV